MLLLWCGCQSRRQRGGTPAQFCLQSGGDESFGCSGIDALHGPGTAAACGCGLSCKPWSGGSCIQKHRTASQTRMGQAIQRRTWRGVTDRDVHPLASQPHQGVCKREQARDESVRLPPGFLLLPEVVRRAQHQAPLTVDLLTLVHLPPQDALRVSSGERLPRHRRSAGKHGAGALLRLGRSVGVRSRGGSLGCIPLILPPRLLYLPGRFEVSAVVQPGRRMGEGPRTAEPPPRGWGSPLVQPDSPPATHCLPLCPAAARWTHPGVISACRWRHVSKGGWRGMTSASSIRVMAVGCVEDLWGM